MTKISALKCDKCSTLSNTEHPSDWTSLSQDKYDLVTGGYMGVKTWDFCSECWPMVEKIINELNGK